MVGRSFAGAGVPRRALFPRRAGGGDVVCRAPDAKSGNFGFSCHFPYISQYFDSVKIPLDGHRCPLYWYLYDVKITEGASDAAASSYRSGPEQSGADSDGM